MARFILKLRLGFSRTKLVSMKCKDRARAREIAQSRPNCIERTFKDDYPKYNRHGK